MRHRDPSPSSDRVLTDLAEPGGWDFSVTDNIAVYKPEVVIRFQLVIWSNVTRDVLPPVRRDSLKHWVDNLDGWMGAYAVGVDIAYDWVWYVDTLPGAQLVFHTMQPKHQIAALYTAVPG